MTLTLTTKDLTGGINPDEALSVIEAGHPPIAEGVILIDFDSTIAPFGYLFSYPKPFPGISKFAKRLKAKGYTIGIFTSRLSPKWLKADKQNKQEHIDYITNYCEMYDIPIDFITAEKVPAIVYIDDKAITFTGSWTDITNQFKERGWL